MDVAQATDLLNVSRPIDAVPAVRPGDSDHDRVRADRSRARSAVAMVVWGAYQNLRLRRAVKRGGTEGGEQPWPVSLRYRLPPPMGVVRVVRHK